MFSSARNIRPDLLHHAFPSLTCLLGANGAGKTTTIEAISFAFADDMNKFRCALVVQRACTPLVVPIRGGPHKRKSFTISTHDAHIAQRR